MTEMQGADAVFTGNSAGAPVVLIHASASSGRQWRGLVERLAPRYRVAAPDLCGYGKAAAGAWSFEGDCRRIRHVVETAAAPVHLVGHSYGGVIAIKTALDAGARIRSLTLIEPVCFHLLEEAGEAAAFAEISGVRDRQVEHTTRGDLTAAARGFVEYWMGRRAWEAMAEERRAAIAQVMPKVVAEWPGAFDATTRLSQYAAFSSPVSLICAGDTTLAARTVAGLIAQRLGESNYAEIAGGGHMSPVTNPDAVNAAIERFLDDAA